MQPINAVNFYLESDFEDPKNPDDQLRLKKLTFDLARSNVDWPGGQEVSRDGKAHGNTKVGLRFVWVFIANKLGMEIPESTLSILQDNLNDLYQEKRYPSIRQLFGNSSSVRTLRNGQETKAYYCRIVDLFDRTPNTTTGKINTELLEEGNIYVMVKGETTAGFRKATTAELEAIYYGFDAAKLEIVALPKRSDKSIDKEAVKLPELSETPKQAPEPPSLNPGKQVPPDDIEQKVLRLLGIVPINLMTIPILITAVICLVGQLLPSPFRVFSVVPLGGFYIAWCVFCFSRFFYAQAVLFANESQTDSLLQWWSHPDGRSNSISVDSHRLSNRPFPIRLAISEQWTNTGIAWILVIFLVAKLMEYAVGPDWTPGLMPFLAASSVVCIFLWSPTVLAYYATYALWKLRTLNERACRIWFSVLFGVLWLATIRLMLWRMYPALIEENGLALAILLFVASPFTGFASGHYSEALAAAISFCWVLLPLARVMYAILWPDERAQNEIEFTTSQGVHSVDDSQNVELSAKEKKERLYKFGKDFFDENRVVVKLLLPFLILVGRLILAVRGFIKPIRN